MKTAKRCRVIFCCLILALSFILPMGVYAAEAASVTISGGNYASTGSDVAVTVTYTGSGIGGAQAALTYDPAVLAYVGGEGTHSPSAGTVNIALVAGAAGAQSLATTIIFTPLKVAETQLSLASTKVLEFQSETDMGLPTAQKTLKIYDPSEITVSGITLEQLPAKLAYPKDGMFDRTGLKVTATFPDGSSEDVTDSVALSGFDSSSTGAKTVTVSFGGKTASFRVYIFGFKSVSLSLLGKVVINFTADFAGMESAGFTPGILFFRENPTATAIDEAYKAGSGVTKYTLNGGYPMFSYDNIAAKEMNDRVYCVLYAKKGSTVSYGNVSSISAAQYVSMAFNSYSDQNLRVMLVDMLNYGSAAQQYFNYSTRSLANAGLSASQKALGTKSNVSLSSAMKLYNDSLSSSKVTIKSASLTLENEISINYSAQVTGGQVAKAELLIFNGYQSGGTYNEKTAASISPMTLKNGLYTGSIKNIVAKAMRSHYHARVRVTYKDGSVAYSGIGRYSVETYAHTVRSNSAYAQSLKNLTESMMRYGDSAKRYFG